MPSSHVPGWGLFHAGNDRLLSLSVHTHTAPRRSTRSRSTKEEEEEEEEEEEVEEEEEEEEEEDEDEEESEEEYMGEEEEEDRKLSVVPARAPRISGGGGKMSEFEKERLENIKRNQEMLRALGLGSTRAEIGLTAAATRLKQPRKTAAGSSRGLKPAKREAREPTRRSARTQGKEAPFYNEEKLILEVENQAFREEVKRMDEGPLTLETLNRSEEGGADFLELLKKLMSERETAEPAAAAATSAAPAASSSKAKPNMDYVERLAALTLAEEDIIKLTPARVTSMVVHPSERTLVVVAADVDGHLGVWQVDGDKEVFQFRPHIAKVASMQYHPADASKLISASHDGTVRCLDLEKQAFDLIVATDEKFQDSGFTCASQAAHSPNNLYLAGHEGSTGLFDLRGQSLAWVHGEAHGKKVNSIEAHPTRPHLFISSSTDRAVTLWDDRKPKKEVWTIAHTNSINNATFNPTGEHLLVTCQDHKLYLHPDPVAAATPPEVATAQYKIKHNNNTGRWLSKFWPMWDPKHPDAFVIGSLEQPRRIEVYSASSGFQIASVRSDYMNSCQSINVFHPTRNILVGANSSGRIHLYREGSA